MKTLSYITRALAVCLLMVSVPLAVLAPASVHAQASGDTCDAYFLGFPAWYRGLGVGADCEIVAPSAVDGIGPFIWIIVLNVVEMILRLVGYAAVGFIIYGGYKYMISTGSPEGIAGAKKTILNAVVGLIISIAAIAIVRTISSGMGIGG